ncbi:MAG TPA: alpha/beta fold hydrolase [Solirubrobacterales bacterium]|nr:alpha/beta fold hydrolase [Solirubrobacterales bacterium]
MGVIEVKRAARLAYREALPETELGPPLLLVHGFPESSYMWRHLMPAIAAAGRRAVAPDLLGYGDSPPDPPGTWEHQVEALEEFRREAELGRCVLTVHDWGGLIGLRWACEIPDAVAGLVVSNTGFFPAGKWHGMAQALRTEGQGEELMANLTREALGMLLRDASRGIDEAAVDEYWKAFATEEGRRGPLELYRSGNFEKLVPYQGKLAELGVPMLILWGEDDEYAPVAGAYRFNKEVPGSELVIVEGAGHFVYEDDPERCAREVTAFLDRV